MFDRIMSSMEDGLPVMYPMNGSPEAATPASVGAPETEAQPVMNVNGDCCNFSAADSFPLSMAYVPMQKFRKLYTPEEALAAGTLFEELNLPFLGYKRGGRA